MMKGDGAREIAEYLEDPEALIALIEDVLNAMLASVDNSRVEEKQTQLTEVSKSIDQLTKLSVPIPNELRNLKLNLVKEIDSEAQSLGEAEKLLARIKESVGRIEESYFGKTARRKGGAKSNLPRTPPKAYQDKIVSALRELGGSAKTSEVLDLIEKRMTGSFLPGDLERNKRGRLIWKYYAAWARIALKEDGILKSDSPHGVWELSETGE